MEIPQSPPLTLKQSVSLNDHKRQLLLYKGFYVHYMYAYVGTFSKFAQECLVTYVSIS